MPLFAVSSADLPDIVRLVNAAYRGDGAKAGWTHEADYLAGQRTDLAMLTKDLGTTPGARILGWRDAPAGELLGCVWLEPDAAEAWYLGMLTVRPDLQDRGLGREILEAAERHAAELGARRIRLTVVGVRDSLIAWYERRGYTLTGERDPFPYEDRRFGEPLRDDLDFVKLEKTL
ncbi:GNAT family N-acetyltransferase [Phenylobacterium sp. LjRoot225]|uniref:GNAT family N-acetyltransferase n=1 Tax=Phenylobacterium sp. LjRoot225 TaxID=3342285 RepID=UPI003ED138EF